jgi:natural product biosynthesis luciferase-like monooxygenase protein
MSEPKHGKSRITCVLVGGQSILIACGDSLLRKGHDIKAVISSDDDVVAWCRQRGVRHSTARPPVFDALSESEFDFLFSIANYQILPRDALSLANKAAINFHDGPLPHYAGLNAPIWSLLNRETRHAVTWHIMGEEADKGPILKQQTLPILPDDTALSLNARCYDAAIKCFDELIDELSTGVLYGKPQDLSLFRFFSRSERPSPGCILDWRRSSDELDAMVRALTFGPYYNPVGLPKVMLAGRTFVVEALDRVPVPASRPGTVLAMGDGSVTIACRAGGVRLRQLSMLSGERAPADHVLADNGYSVGSTLPLPDISCLPQLEAIDKRACTHEAFWLDRLLHFEPPEIPFRKSGVNADPEVRFLAQHISRPRPSIPRHLTGDGLLLVWLAYVARIGGKQDFFVAYGNEQLRIAVGDHGALIADHVPLHVMLDDSRTFEQWLPQGKAELEHVAKQFSYAQDLFLRHPDLKQNRAALSDALAEVVVERVPTLVGFCPSRRFHLGVVIPDDSREILWVFDPAHYDERTIRRMQAQFAAFLEDAAVRRTEPVSRLSTVPSDELGLMAKWNATGTAYDARLVHQVFEEQVRRTPDAIALVFREEAMSFRELDARAHQVALRLQASGVGPDHMVGLMLSRSTEMVIGMLGILKAGGAYVPLDPAYPKDRILYMIEDAKLQVVVTEAPWESLLPDTGLKRIHVDAPGRTELLNKRLRDPGTEGDHLAYAIYTSGSTGKPKGVMITHRNVANFFAGMDARITRDEGDTWLAVTSISFDISVLEILWSLTRGLKVVLYSGDDRTAAQAPTSSSLNFSLYYFPSDDGTETREQFALLMDGAKFADANGFEAVWTPERHFHAFGGLFPNPSISSAAVAAVTQNVKIRAGSCVLPLHHPVRVAEEWSFVDNLSNGRVGISFATGWQPEDFVLAPQNYANRHAFMYQGIETVRALWRGETVTLSGPTGKPVSIGIKPRPVQKELPFWVTAAGNPETFRQAGTMGANLLTHLLGQSLEELDTKLRIYREARRENGHPGKGHVTLMLHTLVGPDEDEVRSKARPALKSYLGTAASLIKHYASSFPAFKAQVSAGRNVDEVFASLSGDDVDALLEHAVTRYYETSGLFGTPDQCMAMVERCEAIGVDEIACLVDFGMSPKIAWQHLPHLAELRARACRPADDAAQDYSVPALIEKHGITHFQCTPSMATMLVAGRRGREALARVKHMMVGGEAFPPTLAAELRSLLSGDLINMYGPTETTVWSSTYAIDKVAGAISIGRPIANTTFYVLDPALQPVPIGVPGELYISGDGVVRGYWNRPELTAERFLPDPFAKRPGARMYRTGDLVRYADDGNLEFLGRMDNQVKIRGYRIELGEIESLLRTHPAVHEAAVVVREEDGTKRLAAYLVTHPGQSVTPAALREFLGQHLAEFMIPASFTLLPALPLTPNGKVDRRALPEPNEVSGPSSEFVAPSTQTEKQIAEAWQFLLKRGQIGVNDDFFHIGGDSLGAVQLVAMLSDTFSVELPLEAIFRAPTIVQLAHTIDTLMSGKAAGVA